MGKKGASTDSGLNFLELLLIAFVVLKLTKVIAWSWWIVFLPVLAPLGLIAFIASAYVVTHLVTHLVSYLSEGK